MNRVKEIREAKGMSFEDLAYASRIDLDKLAKIEACESGIQPVERYRIAKALDVDVQALNKQTKGS